MKKKYVLCIALIVSSFLLAQFQSLVVAYPFFAVCKYVLSVLAICYTTKVVLECLHLPKIKNNFGKQICMFLTTLLLMFYFILTLDTFIFHALTWYPGILRYAIYDAYGVLYLVFILPGLLWHLGSENKFL